MALPGNIGSHGLIGGAWRKQPMMLGYSERVRQAFEKTSTGGASTTAASTPVPAGEIHVVNFVSAYHNDPVNRSFAFYVNDSVRNYVYDTFSPVLQFSVESNDITFVLAPGDFIQVSCTGLADTKTVYGVLWGRRIDIDL